MLGEPHHEELAVAQPQTDATDAGIDAVQLHRELVGRAQVLLDVRRHERAHDELQLAVLQEPGIEERGQKRLAGPVGGGNQAGADLSARPGAGVPRNGAQHDATESRIRQNEPTAGGRACGLPPK